MSDGLNLGCFAHEAEYCNFGYQGLCGTNPLENFSIQVQIVFELQKSFMCWFNVSLLLDLQISNSYTVRVLLVLGVPIVTAEAERLVQSWYSTVQLQWIHWRKRRQMAALCLITTTVLCSELHCHWLHSLVPSGMSPLRLIHYRYISTTVEYMWLIGSNITLSVIIISA